MNLLAHIYLSGDDEEIIAGNFIGDHVKGNNIKKYSNIVQKGILIHRQIDYYTDNHKMVKLAKSKFQVKYGKYSGVVVDIIFDHILANNWQIFSEISYEDFIKKAHKVLEKYYFIFPIKVKEFFPYFVQNNWLKIYKRIEGIEIVLNGMTRRTSLPNEATFAIEKLKNDYVFFEKIFLDFFPEIIQYVSRNYEIRMEWSNILK